MSKLLPGGWHRGTGNGEGSIFADEGRMRLEEGGTTLYPICKMVKGWDPEEDEANEFLVAAAPALLVALEKLVAEVECYCGDNPSGVCPIHEAQAAIAKAKGA
jgi:hypothetical protein